MQPEQPDFGPVLSTDNVIGYLTSNPEFFVSNEDLLARLKVPHNAGPAVSLIEKQVSVLRNKCGDLENSLRDLIAVARQNESLHQRLHNLIQEVITAPSIEDIVRLTQTRLRDNFSAESVHIMLIAPTPKRAPRRKTSEPRTSGSKVQPRKSARLPSVEGAIMVRSNDRRVRAFADVFASGSTVCGMPTAEQLEAMVGKSCADVASAAIIPLHFERRLGVVMLTSRDESRFGVSKGVMFLNQMGDLLGRRIHSYNAHAQVFSA